MLAVASSPVGNGQAVKGTQYFGHRDFSYQMVPQGDKASFFLTLYSMRVGGQKSKEGMMGGGLTVIKELFCARFHAKHFYEQRMFQTTL